MICFLDIGKYCNASKVVTEGIRVAVKTNLIFDAKSHMWLQLFHLSIFRCGFGTLIMHGCM